METSSYLPKVRSIRFILVTLLLDFIGFGIVIPVMPRLLMELTQGDIGKVARVGGYLAFSYAFAQFIFAPILGGLSDRYGRRTILLTSLFGLGIDYILLALAPNIELLFIGRIIAGIVGASYTTAGAYIADISEPEDRAQNFGLIGAVFGIGFTVGPVIGGILGSFGLRVPFYFAAVLCFLNWLYGYFFLKESLEKMNRRKFDFQRANPFGALRQLMKLPLPIVGLLGALGLIFIANHSSETTWSYITIAKFGWSEKTIGYSLGLYGISTFLVLSLVIKKVIPILGYKKTSLLGIGIRIIISLLFALSPWGWMMFVLIVPFCFSFLTGASIQGYVSTQISASEQGEFQGILGSITGITSILGPAIMTGLFSFFTESSSRIIFPGAPFVLSAFLAVLAGIITWFSFRYLER